MSKTYNTKDAQSRKQVRLDSAKRAGMSRHPDGTRAKGLKQDYKGMVTVASDRDRFGEAEEQSSRMRRQRRAAVHSARRRLKKELESQIEEDLSQE